MPDPLRRRVRAGALRAFAGAARALPEPLARAPLAAAAGLARLSPWEGRIAANLELALGGDTTPLERRRIARGVRHHAARLLYEWSRLAAGRGAAGPWLRARVRVDDSIEVLERELARGRGALVVAAHVGNWELLACALRERGFEGAVVGRERRRDPAARFLPELRRAWDVESVPQDTAARPLLRRLAAGRIVGLLADLEVRRLAGAFVPFFGVPALTMTAPAALARAADLPLVPVRCVLGADGTYALSAEEPLALDRSLGGRAATLDLTRRLNGVYERWIRAAPEQWAWHQPRWRTRPGERELVPLAARRSRGAPAPEAG